MSAVGELRPLHLIVMRTNATALKSSVATVALLSQMFVGAVWASAEATPTANGTFDPRGKLTILLSRTDERGWFCFGESFPGGSTKAGGELVVLTHAEMTKLCRSLQDRATFRWEDMTAVTPYPSNQVALLWRGVSPSGSDSWMCSVGEGEGAVSRLRKIAECLSGKLKDTFENALQQLNPRRKCIW